MNLTARSHCPNPPVINPHVQINSTPQFQVLFWQSRHIKNTLPPQTRVSGRWWDWRLNIRRTFVLVHDDVYGPRAQPVAREIRTQVYHLSENCCNCLLKMIWVLVQNSFCVPMWPHFGVIYQNPQALSSGWRFLILITWFMPSIMKCFKLSLRLE